jgi:hypothetical protein
MSRDDAGPTPAALLHSIDDLIDADHPPTSGVVVLEAIRAALAADPNGTGDPNWTIAALTAAFQMCETGTVDARATSCGELILRLDQAYRYTGIASDEAAAAAVYDYGFNALSRIPTTTGGTRDAWTGVVPDFLRHAVGG